MTSDDVKFFFLEVAPYASMFGLLAGLIFELMRRCKSWKTDDD